MAASETSPVVAGGPPRLVPVAAPDANPASREALRESVISLYRKDQKIYARAVSGWFARWRWALVWATQLLFYGLPWLPWNGRQAVLFDLVVRRFYIFDLVLYPQDFIYLTGLLVVAAFSLFLFTAVAGRLWCGYACPQTVYTEIFMWVERHTEGDRMQRMRLDAAPWGPEKIARKGGKQFIWLGIGLWTGFTFVGYFTPIRELWAAAFTAQFTAWESFWTLFYGLATYGNAGWMREQVCKYMCPYARFQGAMFDKHTLIIGYDAQRGEPRGKHRAQGRKTDLQAAQLGHCIDCGLCVQVCPTGIDIRQGLQLECIGCAACVDVCNGVMDKMQYPRGLVRYDTEQGLQQPQPGVKPWRQKLLRPRVLVYSAVLLIGVGGLATSLALRAPFRVDVERDRGSMARVVDEGWVENGYRMQVMNATEQVQHYRIRVEGLPGAVLDVRSDIELGPAQARWVAVSVRVPPEQAHAAGAGSHRMAFFVDRVPSAATPATRSVHEASTFLVPH